MNILYVTDTLALWGGIERVISIKAQELTERYGYNIRILTTNQGSHPLPFGFPDNVKYIDMEINTHFQYRYSLIKRLFYVYRMKKMFVNRLREQIDDFQPDVIMLIVLNYADVVNKVAKDIPWFFESHSSYFSEKYEERGFLFRFNCYLKKLCLHNANGIVALTKKDSENWKKVNDNSLVIPNVVHLNYSGVYSHCRSRRIIYVGRFAFQKGIDSLIKIWDIVFKYHPDWHLDMYGEGELKDYYKAYVNKRNNNIHIHQPVSNIILRYCESSMLLLTSVYEPFGLVLPEGMSCGLPVVAFDCSYGPAEIIHDGVDGFLVKERDIFEFAKRVCQLIDDEPLRVKMGRAAIKSSQRYGAESIMPQWKKLFEEVVQ